MSMLRDSAISIAVTLAFVATVETLARAIYTFINIPPAPVYLDTTRPDPVLGWTMTPGYVGPIEYSIGQHSRTFDSNGHLAVDTAQIADTTRRKIVTLGDSTTFGWGIRTEESYPELLDAWTAADVINLAVYGYSSYQGRIVFERYLAAHRVDLVIAGFSFNDRRYVLPGEPPDSPTRYAIHNDTTPRVPVLLERSYAFRAMRRAARAVGVIPTPQARPPSRALIHELRPRVDESAYVKNLSAIVELARSHGIPVILLVLVDNPVYTFQIDAVAGLPPADRIAHLWHLARVMQSHAALARQALVTALREQGDTTSAEQEQWMTVLWDESGGDVVRASSTYADLTRRVAADRDVPLVLAPNAPALYLDSYHLNATGHRVLADRLRSALGASGVISAAPSTPARSVE